MEPRAAPLANGPVPFIPPTSPQTEVYDKPLTLEILSLVNESQQQHGLRHSDYQRYRQYCSRRIRRLRHSLHFNHTSKSKRFNKKPIVAETVTDVRFLHILLMLSERAWSFAMQLKEQSNTEPRKRFHLIRRMKKAVGFTSRLESLCSSVTRVDAGSRLESQAYCSWMKGMLSFELSRWSDALVQLTVAANIYQKLDEAFGGSSGFALKREEVLPSIRYCAYNIGDETTIKALLRDRVPELDAESLVIPRESPLEVVWNGSRIPVRNRKAKEFISNCEKLVVSGDLAIDTVVDTFDKLSLEAKDAMESVKEEGKKGEEVNQLVEYLGFLQLSKTLDRNVLMCEALERSAGIASGGAGIASGGAGVGGSSKKATKPSDLVRIYDMIIQNLKDILESVGDGNPDMRVETELRVVVYRAFRCYTIAVAHNQANKSKEAYTLFQRAESLADGCLHSSLRSLRRMSDLFAKVTALKQSATSEKYTAYAATVLELKTVEPVVKSKLQDESLIDTLERSDIDVEHLLANNPQPFVQFPPEFQPVPCKPLFFDLALNSVRFPGLEDKMGDSGGTEQQPGGLQL